MCALQGHVAQVVLAKRGRIGGVADLCNDGTEFVGEVALGHFAVAVVEFDASSLLDAVVGFGGEAGEDVDGIEREAFACPFEGMDDAVAGSLQNNQQKNAASHSESCSERTEFVTAQ